MAGEEGTRDGSRQTHPGRLDRLVTRSTRELGESSCGPDLTGHFRLLEGRVEDAYELDRVEVRYGRYLACGPRY